jgi:Putative Actinobacterial Holin-X, holin superfamily III
MTDPDVTAVRVTQSSGNIGAGTDVTQHSVGELVKEVTSDLTKLFNQELALAKLEMSNEAKKAGKTAGAYGGAGVAGYFAVLFASLTLMFALATLFDSFTWAALVVTVLWAVAGAVLYSRAKKTAAQINPKPEMTVQTLKEDAQWAKTRKS